MIRNRIVRFAARRLGWRFALDDLFPLCLGIDLPSRKEIAGTLEEGK